MKLAIQASAIALAAGLTSAQGVSNGSAPYPNATYPGATDPSIQGGAQFGQTSPPFYPSPWIEGLGDWGEAYARAQAFVRQLTLLEKVNLTTGVGWQGGPCVGNVGEIPRLAFHSLCMQDSPLGVRLSDYNSAFLAGGTSAASWDRGVWYRRGYDIGSEHRDKGIDVVLGPVVGPLGRSPEGGRNWEGFSPDPVLSGIAVAQSVRGIQDAGVVACTKHYIGNEQEHFRQRSETPGFTISESLSSNIDDVTMHELYLWPFADAVRAGTGSIMCSYQQINNSYGCQNSYTQNYLLKGELGFQGFVMSDWQAQHAGVATALAGLDMTMPGDVLFNTGTSFWGPNLTLSVINGTIPAWRLDDMATRIMAAYFYVGRDEVYTPTNFNSWTRDVYGAFHPAAGEEYGYGLVNQRVDVRDAHGADIRNMASRSTVLLKNTNGALPLTGRERFTGVFGEDADNNPWGPNGCPDRGCDNGTLAMGWGSGTANFPYLVTPLEAIKNEIVPNDGLVQGVTDNYAYSQIAGLASQVSVAIVFVNADAGEGYIIVDGNVGDRNNLTLWKNGDTLIQNVTAVCNNTIVVIHSVGPVLVNSFYQNPNVTAIVWAGLPGQESGNSIADVLYGRHNPGGKLPFTMGLSRQDYGTDILYRPNNGNNAPQVQFTEGVFIDYRHFDRANITPAYEFGFGLSYTTFSYSNLQISRHNVGDYVPTTGLTSPAPVLNANFSTNAADYQFPAGFRQVPLFIYPYLNSTDPRTASRDPEYGLNVSLPAGATDGSPQPRIAAGGAPGGNPELYDVMFTATATITNTGRVGGEEVAQLYLSLGGPNDPRTVLRGFERLSIQPGMSTTLTVDITRRDLSNWDPVAQNWVITSYPKTVYVGSSSRNLVLSSALTM